MKKNKSVLGKGLNSMLGGSHGVSIIDTPRTDGGTSIANIALDKIYPNESQPRQHFDEERLSELADSIRQLGLVQPITVYPDSAGRYCIISGERRYRASKLAGLSEIPAYIREVEDKEVLELALVENIQRENLNAIEVALAYQGLLERTGATHEAIAERVGKKRTSVSNYLRLLRLPSEIQLGLSEHKLEMGHARALLQIEDTERQMELYHLCIQEGLSVREVEEIARAIKEGKNNEEVPAPKAKSQANNTKIYKTLEEHLGKVFGSKVSLKCNPNGQGRISIPFSSESDMERLIALLERVQDINT